MAKKTTMVALLTDQNLKQGTSAARSVLAKQAPVANLVRLTDTQNLGRYLRPTAHR